jgi:hypothetical protein
VQHAIVVGTLLGDGSMRCKTNALLEINHSFDQRNYVEWKYRHLVDLVSTPPRELELSRLMLAVWFMDDGCRSRNAVYLNTQQFDRTSQERLLRLLREQWGVEGTLNRDKSLLSNPNLGSGNRSFRAAHRWISATGAQVQASARDPVTTEALVAEVVLLPQSGQINERYNTPTPRLWSGRVKT